MIFLNIESFRNTITNAVLTIVESTLTERILILNPLRMVNSTTFLKFVKVANINFGYILVFGCFHLKFLHQDKTNLAKSKQFSGSLAFLLRPEGFRCPTGADWSKGLALERKRRSSSFPTRCNWDKRIPSSQLIDFVVSNNSV